MFDPWYFLTLYWMVYFPIAICPDFVMAFFVAYLTYDVQLFRDAALVIMDFFEYLIRKGSILSEMLVTSFLGHDQGQFVE